MINEQDESILPLRNRFLEIGTFKAVIEEWIAELVKQKKDMRGNYHGD
jgi:hypothetical protein